MAKVTDTAQKQVQTNKRKQGNRKQSRNKSRSYNGAKNNGSKEMDFDFTSLSRYANSKLVKTILRDLNKDTRGNKFFKYTKDDIMKYLQDPQKYEKEIREAVIYMYNTSSHFRRIVQHFVSLTDASYVITPSHAEVGNVEADTLKSEFQQCTEYIKRMDLKQQTPSILTVATREDVCYITTIVGDDSIIFKRLPSDYCKVTEIESNVLNVTFDFKYFDKFADHLDFYPKEFKSKHNKYLTNKQGLRYQVLDSPLSFAIKCNRDILDYASPPLVGVLPNLYDLSDYQSLRMTKTELENYAMLVMKLALNSEGEFTMDYGKAKKFWSNMDAVLPEQVGSVLSPMAIDKISFGQSGTSETNNVANAEQQLFTASGISSLLFNNEKASANALLTSIKSDQSITYGIIKSLESAINRILSNESFGNNFRLKFLDCSPYNREEVSAQYLKAATYGLPTISYYCASVGLEPNEIEAMNFFEGEVLNLIPKFKPLQSSNTQSGGVESGDAGRKPNADSGKPLSDAGEQTAEAETNGEYE